MRRLRDLDEAALQQIELIGELEERLGDGDISLEDQTFIFFFAPVMKARVLRVSQIADHQRRTEHAMFYECPVAAGKENAFASGETAKAA